MLTRRSFIEKISQSAGLGYLALSSFAMIPAAPVHAFSPSGSTTGKKIVVLGAGLAGMTAAWELLKLNYDVTILEARNRTGGRVWTVRGGTHEQEIDGEAQECHFDSGQYLNAGAARIPHHHLLTLHYCKELDVPLEIYNNINEGAYYYSQQGKGKLANKRIRIRELHNDLRGYVTELLHKSISSDQLDLPLTREDEEKFLEYLRVEGDLDIDKVYKGTSRRGYLDYPGAGDRPGQIDNPYPLDDLIQAGYLDPSFSNLAEYDLNLQQTLFQPKGGMDKISAALENKVKKHIQVNARVEQINNTENGVQILYSSAGKETLIEADYCICTIPLPVLSRIKNNFSQNVQRSIDFIRYNSTGKIGLQFKRRFWEEDDQIFGGISRTNMDITQIFYPNSDYLAGKGVVVGYYNFGEKAERIAGLSLKEREKVALQQGARIHPQYLREFENSFSLAWQKTQYSEGGWSQYNEATRQRFYKNLIEPDQHVYFAGEHTTYLNAWMAGAFESARRTVDQIHARVNETERKYQQIKN